MVYIILHATGLSPFQGNTTVDCSRTTCTSFAYNSLPLYSLVHVHDNVQVHVHDIVYVHVYMYVLHVVACHTQHNILLIQRQTPYSCSLPHTHTLTHVNTCTHVHYVYVHAYTCLQAYTSLHVHMYTCTHVHMYTCTCTCVGSGVVCPCLLQHTQKATGDLLNPNISRV